MTKPIDWAACERLVKHLASKFLQSGLHLEDLEQEARLAVIEASGDYTPELGVSLNTFLGRRIRDSLRSYTLSSLDLVEVSREWVAESIAGGEDIKTKSKEECKALRSVLGADKYRKPYRREERVRATTSLDADASGDDPEESYERPLHETLGREPEQETEMLVAQVAKNKMGGPDSEIVVVFRLRNEGYTFPQIGKLLDKEPDAVRMAFRRMKNRLHKKKAV